jgi:hypothetical protein
MMRGSGLFPLPVLMIALLLGGTALAQNVGDNSVYFVTYFSNEVQGDVRDQTVRIINDGDTGANLWATFYTYDDSQEMQECCSCEVSPDGLLSESVRNNLTNNPLTGIRVSRGAIKIISSSVNAGGPNFTNTTMPGLRGWATHLQSVRNQYPYGPEAYSQTETALADSNLGSSDKTLQEELCFFIHLLGGGHQGVCSCTPEDLDF